MYRAGLLAVLLLAVVAAANVTLTCTVESRSTVDTTGDIRVSFDFTSIAPVFPDKGIRFTDNLIYSPATSAQWDGPLEFKVILEHYAPNQRWRIDRYRCVYNRSGNVQVRHYHVVAQTPERRTTTITFTVPATAARHSESTSVKVSRPLEGTYCSAPPTVESWPNCPAFKAEDNRVSAEYPGWQALQVNGRRPGDVVRAHGVNATIPDPWEYDIESDVGKLSVVFIDGTSHRPRDVKGVPVKSSVDLRMVGMPKQWGTVHLKGVSVPLYVLKDILSSEPPTNFCRPPSCFVLNWANLTTTCERADGSRYVVRLYAAMVAVKSGDTLYEVPTFVETSSSTVYLPLGSVIRFHLTVRWRTTYAEDAAYPFGDPYLRVIRDPTFYEEIAKKGKIHGPFPAGQKPLSRSVIALAVDEHVRNLELAPYSPPSAVYGIIYNWYPIVQVCENKGIIAHLKAPAWLTEALKHNYPDISGGRYLDLLHFLYGEPTTYYWGQGDQYGMVYVRTEPYYAGTTADRAGSIKLYYTTGVAPTDAQTFSITWGMPETDEDGSRRRNGVSPWLVALVPTTACRSMFCTLLSPELLGPLPPFPGDRALPNTGHSIMLMYLGETGRHKVKVYVEDGYVISSGPPISVSRARNYKLVEIDKEWKPFEAVIVGPGWWVPYRRLGPCETMPVRASSIYATPDQIGPVKITVEDNGRNSTYVFYVTDKVMYRITTRTPALESITATPFNITARILLGGVPYYHAAYGYGEGGRLSPPACASTRFDIYRTSQLFISGDFWGSFGLAHMPLKPVNIQYIYTKPRLELVEPWRGLVRVRADGPVSGFAFYAQRGGTWVKIGEASGSCVLINASRLFPWDPILALPLVGQELEATPGSTVAIWRPETALLFKTWADVVGYPKGARSVLEVVRRC